MSTVSKVITLFGDDDDENEGNSPFVVSFESAPQPEILESTGSMRSSDARITCYERPHKVQKKESGHSSDKDAEDAASNSESDDDDDEDSEEDVDDIDVVAETKKTLFHGTTSDRTKLRLRHAIGIRDKSSGNITFVEVPPVITLHKFMKLSQESISDELEKEAGTKIEMSEYMKFRNNLTEVFGNHKKKLQIRAATANALPDQISDVTEEEITQTREAISEMLKEEEHKDKYDDLPMFDRAALTAGEAYPLSSMFFKDVLDVVYEKVGELLPLVREGPMAFMHKFADISSNVSVYAAEVIKQINAIPKDRIKNVVASLVLYNYLVTFYQLPLSSIRSNKRILQSIETTKVPEAVTFAFTKRFLDKVYAEGTHATYQRNKLSVLKMRNYMTILALRIEDFALDPKSVNFIARDFGVQVSVAVLNLERVGATRKKIPGREASEENTRWVLQVPIKPRTRAHQVANKRKRPQ